MSKKLLDVRIDYINLDQAVEEVSGWLKKRSKHYVVTPNPEMLVDAGFDSEFKYVLNQSDLAIPDSSRLRWGSFVVSQKSLILRLIYMPFFLFPGFLPGFKYPVTTGVDLMERLLSLSEEKGLTTAYLGGTKEVADKLFKCLRLKYPDLKIAFCSGNMAVNDKGEMRNDIQRDKMTVSKSISLSKRSAASFNHHLLVQKIDILFVAFGHKKQEKWIYKNLPKLNTRVMLGVGGGFDYLAGAVPRAPKLMRQVGMEWLFRFIVQPWRVKRYWKLIFYIYKIISAKR